MSERRGAVIAGSATVVAALLLRRMSSGVLRWPLRAALLVGAAITANEISGKPVPFLRWSVLRLALGGKHLLTHWQVGDGREEAVARYVVERARRGDVDHAIATIDEFGHQRSMLINVGDEKGEILDAAVRRVGPRRVLELGTYCGYSALRIARTMPSDAHLYSIEFSPDNAAIARRILDHAGVADRVTVVVGTLGDGGATLQRLRDEHGFGAETLDFVFIDHAKDHYLPDLRRILDAGWLRHGAVVVADNVGFPGAPDYRAYLRENENNGWRTVEHDTHLEYQSMIKDVVTESEYLGGGGAAHRVLEKGCDQVGR